MKGDKQIQKAGANSLQCQVDNLTVISGVSEERVRAIFAEQSQIVRREYTEDAYRIAGERVGKFEECFMPRIAQVENALASFANPEFQLLLRQAQLKAATTDKETDYSLLSELLICHVQKGDDCKNRAAIKRAVEIVGDIDNDALCGLTVAHAIMTFSPTAGYCIDGVRALNDMFGKIIYRELPAGDEWLDHLDILGAVRFLSLGKMRTTIEGYSSSLNGYICAGIQEESEAHKKAIELLDNAKVNRSILVPNECLNGFYRIAIDNKASIEELAFNIGKDRVPLRSEQKDSLKQIWGMYSTETALIKQAQDKFIEIWDSFDTLSKLRRWWDSIPHSFSITQVGRVLAQTNAKRCDPSLPDLI